MLHPFPGTGSSEVLGRWPYCDSVNSPWGYRLVMLHAIDEETLDGGIQNLTLVPVTGNIHGATVVLVSCRRLWTDVVQRCLISWQEEAGNFAPAVNFRLVFVVDVAMNLHSVVRELQSRRGKILVYGGFLHSARVMELLGSGVNGYVPELARRSELVKAIGALLDGQTVAPFRIPLAESASKAGLTTAEEVAARAYFLHDEPRGRAAVADALGISEKTLGNQLSAVRRKVGAKRGESRTAVARRIAGSGLGEGLVDQLDRSTSSTAAAMPSIRSSTSSVPCAGPAPIVPLVPNSTAAGTPMTPSRDEAIVDLS